MKYRRYRNGETGTLQEIADGYRLRVDYGFSKWFPNMEELLKEWECIDEKEK